MRFCGCRICMILVFGGRIVRGLCSRCRALCCLPFFCSTVLSSVRLCVSLFLFLFVLSFLSSFRLSGNVITKCNQGDFGDDAYSDVGCECQYLSSLVFSTGFLLVVPCLLFPLCFDVTGINKYSEIGIVSAAKMESGIQ